MTPAQSAHIASCFPECRQDMARYLQARAAVIIRQQNECGPDIPPYAIAVASEPEFWIDCAESEKAARAKAKALGLRVIKPQEAH